MATNNNIYITHDGLNITFHIKCDAEGETELEKVFHMFHLENKTNVRPKIVFNIKAEEHGVALKFNHIDILFGSYGEVFAYISDIIVNYCGQESENAYHSAVVVSNRSNKAILLIGCSMAGKTTLAAWLSVHGYTYISDDVACIDNNMKVCPVPTPIKVRRGVLFHSSDFDSSTYSINNDVRLISIPHNPDNCTCEKYDIGYAVFLMRNSRMKKEPYIDCCTSDIAASELFENIYTYKDMLKQRRFSEHLSEAVHTYYLHYKNLDDKLLTIIDSL